MGRLSDVVEALNRFFPALPKDRGGEFFCYSPFVSGDEIGRRKEDLKNYNFLPKGYSVAA